MASSIIPCAVNKCEMISSALCHCCREDLCLDHLKEHRDLLNAQLVPLANQATILKENFDRFEMNSTPAYRTIEQWRQQAHQTIDAFCQKMHEQIGAEKREKPKRSIETIRRALENFIRKQGTTRESIDVFTEGLGVVQQQFDQLSKTQINLKPLTIDENVVIVSDQGSSPKADRVERQAQQNNNNGRRSVASNSLVPTDGSAVLMNESALQIFFQFMGKTQSLLVNRLSSILQIKQKITEKIGIPLEKQCLKLMGKTLQDQQSVELAGILQHSILVVSLTIQPKVEETKTDGPQVKKMKTS